MLYLVPSSFVPLVRSALRQGLSVLLFGVLILLFRRGTGGRLVSIVFTWYYFAEDSLVESPAAVIHHHIVYSVGDGTYLISYVNSLS